MMFFKMQHKFYLLIYKINNFSNINLNNLPICLTILSKIKILFFLIHLNKSN